jgi:glutamine amidotransferase
VFAHSGTVGDLDFLRRRTSAKRARQIAGDSDSELLFAYLLSCLDVGQTNGIDRTEHADTALGFAVREMHEHTPAGEYSFLISDGVALYAHRRGNPLFVLQRRTEQSAPLQSPAVVIVASEPLSDEPWQALEEKTLLCVDRRPTPRSRVLVRGSQGDPPSGSAPELPFTD